MSSVKLMVLIIGVAILIVVGSLSYKSYQSKLKSNSYNQTPDQGNNQPQNNTGSSSNNTIATQSALPKPPQATTGAALDNYVKQVQQIAQTSDTLEITNCSGKPTSLILKQGSKLTIKNNDSKEITIKLNANDTYTVPAKNSQQFTIKAGNALYNYLCVQTGGETFSNAGALEVTP